MEYGRNWEFFKKIEDQGRKTPLDNIPENDRVTDWYIDMFYKLKQPWDMDVSIADQLFAIKEFILIGSADEFLQVMRALNIANREYIERHKPKGE